MRRSRQVCCGLSTITGTVIGFLLGAIFFLRVDVQEKARRMQIQFTELERVLESETRCRENIRATELSIIDLRERLSEKEANSPTNPKTNAGESVLETCRLQIEIEQDMEQKNNGETYHGSWTMPLNPCHAKLHPNNLAFMFPYAFSVR
eukprot:m.473720 g.473720  ORF g.473720 m.473720 type:complete len:149 (+) comp21664_c0_seq49:221-667(+)